MVGGLCFGAAQVQRATQGLPQSRFGIPRRMCYPEGVVATIRVAAFSATFCLRVCNLWRSPMQRNGKVCVVLATFFVCSQTNCATIVSSGFQQVRFTSEPDGARIFLDGAPIGRTPTAISIKTRSAHGVKMTIEGRPDYFVSLERKINGWTFGNLIFGWIPGFIIDAISGANFRLVPENVHADFEPSGQTTDG